MRAIITSAKQVLKIYCRAIQNQRHSQNSNQLPLPHVKLCYFVSKQASRQVGKQASKQANKQASK